MPNHRVFAPASRRQLAAGNCFENVVSNATHGRPSASRQCAPNELPGLIAPPVPGRSRRRENAERAHQVHGAQARQHRRVHRMRHIPYRCLSRQRDSEATIRAAAFRPARGRPHRLASIGDVYRFVARRWQRGDVRRARAGAAPAPHKLCASVQRCALRMDAARGKRRR